MSYGRGPGFTLILAQSRKNLWEVVKPKDSDVEEAGLCVSLLTLQVLLKKSLCPRPHCTCWGYVMSRTGKVTSVTDLLQQGHVVNKQVNK